MAPAPATATSKKHLISPDSASTSEADDSPRTAKRARMSHPLSNLGVTGLVSRETTSSASGTPEPESYGDSGILEIREPTMRVSNHGQGLPKGLRAHHAVLQKDGRDTWVSPDHFYEYSHVSAGYMGFESVTQLKDLMQSDKLQKIAKLYTAIKGRGGVKAKLLFDQYLSGDMLQKLASLEPSEMLEGKDLKIKLGLTADQSIEYAYVAAYITLLVRTNKVFQKGRRNGTLIPGFAASFDEDVNFKPDTESLWRAFVLLKLFARTTSAKNKPRQFSFHEREPVVPYYCKIDTIDDPTVPTTQEDYNTHTLRCKIEALEQEVESWKKKAAQESSTRPADSALLGHPQADSQESIPAETTWETPKPEPDPAHESLVQRVVDSANMEELNQACDQYKEELATITHERDQLLKWKEEMTELHRTVEPEQSTSQGEGTRQKSPFRKTTHAIESLQQAMLEKLSGTTDPEQIKIEQEMLDVQSSHLLTRLVHNFREKGKLQLSADDTIELRLQTLEDRQNAATSVLTMEKVQKEIETQVGKVGEKFDKRLQDHTQQQSLATQELRNVIEAAIAGVQRSQAELEDRMDKRFRRASEGFADPRGCSLELGVNGSTYDHVEEAGMFSVKS